MGWVTQSYLDTWRSGQYVGANAPVTVLQVSRGRWRRNNRPWPEAPYPGFEIGVQIPDEDPDEPWFPHWQQDEPWVTVPGVFSCEITKDFDQNGIPVANLSIENVGFVEQVGPMGQVYRLIERGYLSPTRGYAPDARPESGLAQNEWYRTLGRQVRVRIWQGFGPPTLVDGSPPDDGGENGTWVFNGLVDDVDLTSAPARIGLTARMAKILTDEHVFGWSKSAQLKDPVIFADSNNPDLYVWTGDSAAASSSQDEFPSSNVLERGTKANYWKSGTHSDDDVTEWVEVHLPAGTYHNISLQCDAGMEAYIGVSVRARSVSGATAMPTVDDVEVGEGFVPGLGTVPGANGGWKFVAHVPSTQKGLQTIELDHEIVTGKNSVLRVGFRNLRPEDGTYRARVDFLQARKFKPSPDARKWVLVDDLSDVVKTVLRWAGFQECDVEPVGTNIKGKWVFNRANYLIDIIKKCQEYTGHVFFVADPTSGTSWGVPTFRRRRAILRNVPASAEVRDTDLLADVQVKLAEEPLALIIRVRGREAASGVSVGGDKTKRIMAVYKPPWVDGDPAHDLTHESGGVIKRVIRTEPALRTLMDCQIACFLTAIEEALMAAAASFAIPPLLVLELDDMIGLLDTTTATNSRVWITHITSTHESGDDPRFDMSIQGVLVDTPELEAVIAELDAVDFDPEPAPNVSRTPVVIRERPQP